MQARLSSPSGRSGVVYGDIGTSPLYTEQVIFRPYRDGRDVTRGGRLRRRLPDLLGADDRRLVKYAGFIMRAHNRGDGGIMALSALLQRNRVAHGARW